MRQLRFVVILLICGVILWLGVYSLKKIYFREYINLTMEMELNVKIESYYIEYGWSFIETETGNYIIPLSVASDHVTGLSSFMHNGDSLLKKPNSEILTLRSKDDSIHIFKVKF